ncbi:hypothetical protein TL16_g02261 [Triparma laevis f. inornata]|uniref:Kinesin light chain n=1 Tax=Triparma laevis f. inornata TaxID=1714386 RepID=A0A9W6ZM88_9STRA|nr:hypothetical protein TL16_g02261 [Triparma laevis f. inornata]
MRRSHEENLIYSFKVGVYCESLGALGLWPTSYKNLRQLASGEGFNDYFRNQFNGNEATFLKWKEVFDVLEIVGGMGCNHNVRVYLETQVLTITRLEDLVKLRALAKLCSKEFFDDMSLLVVAWRRILEVLEVAMQVEKKVRGKKKKQQKKRKDPRKLEIWTLVRLWGRHVIGLCRDFDDMIRYLKRAKEGYEEQLGRDSEKTLDATFSLIASTAMDEDKRDEMSSDLFKRIERALGEENVVTLETLSQLGARLDDNGEYEEAIKVHERCLAGRMKVLCEDNIVTFGMLNNLGVVYRRLGNYEKALEYYKRAFKGSERFLGRNHPKTFTTVMNIARVYACKQDYEKAVEQYERALEGCEAQLGKDHSKTKTCVRNFKIYSSIAETKRDSQH